MYRLNELAPAIEGMGAYLLREEAARKATLKTTAPATGSATKGAF